MLPGSCSLRVGLAFSQGVFLAGKIGVLDNEFKCLAELRESVL
jgi:hypothetical protein